jgi:mevalonate kinase
MGKGSGYGKTILFGEHFVVYGLPALASAIGGQTTSTVEQTTTPGYELIDNRPEVPGYKVQKFDEQTVSIQNVIDFMDINLQQQGLKIGLGGDLVCASGVGASAASCVALARAINDEFSLGWDDTKINQAAYEGEKGYHGTPSGIDNTASTFGGLVYFIKNLSGGPNTIKTIQLEKSVELVIASSGMTSHTKEVVADVRKLKDQKPQWFDDITDQYQTVIREGKKALEAGEFQSLGSYMNQNHTLLQEITVSNETLDGMVQLARNAGALGAKVTGTGRGGNMIALTPGKSLQDTVAKTLEEKGFMVWKTLIGV